jgi:acetyl-CoA C-acetyltransferase
MIETAENLARDYRISREAADAYAVESHRRAAAAWEAGRFEAEVTPLSVPQRGGSPALVQRDEGIRADTSVEKLAALKPIQRDGIVTAGNASQQNDAAAACLVVAEHLLESLDLKPIAYFVAASAAGCDPSRMGIGPVPAVKRLFARARMHWDQIDLIELNEAFAPQVLAVLKAWEFDDRSRINVNGSGISLGHPIAATGARILTTMLHELQRRRGRYALETMCIGGGQGLAAVFERV